MPQLRSQKNKVDQPVDDSTASKQTVPNNDQHVASSASRTSEEQEGELLLLVSLIVASSITHVTYYIAHRIPLASQEGEGAQERQQGQGQEEG